ncbi:MAG TPA: orotate phosphoribosyltransferase [Clostridia bacterium]|nr:orotate phosphoribosyltransferase [Clostridia bacterium]
MDENIIKWLFLTDAFKVSPPDEPFWYTSGKIGPYYINTHYLYGGKEKAEALLERIDAIKDDRLNCPSEIARLTAENFKTDPIYPHVIDMMCKRIRSAVPLEDIDFISGGERRDWFFSFMTAKMLNKPHLTIYKDLSAVTEENGRYSLLGPGLLKGARVLHIAELVTEASSYKRTWIPAIKMLGADILWTCYIIDRNQGGERFFAENNIKALPLVHIDETFFAAAFEMGLINKEQLDILTGYYKNPDETMRQFIKNNPEFITRALNSDPKTAQRARLCIQNGFYD